MVYNKHLTEYQRIEQYHKLYMIKHLIGLSFLKQITGMSEIEAGNLQQFLDMGKPWIESKVEGLHLL